MSNRKKAQKTGHPDAAEMPNADASPPLLPPGRAEPVEDRAIAEAAYYRWLREGGDAESNWLAAEQECWARRGETGKGDGRGGR